MAIGHDPSTIKGQKITKTTIRRVLEFARPYRSMLIGFIITLVLAALVNLVPPLLFDVAVHLDARKLGDKLLICWSGPGIRCLNSQVVDCRSAHILRRPRSLRHRVPDQLARETFGLCP